MRNIQIIKYTSVYYHTTAKELNEKNDSSQESRTEVEMFNPLRHKIARDSIIICPTVNK